jgi:hypothetical protein
LGTGIIADPEESERDERARRRAKQWEQAKWARHRFRQQLALQQEANQPAQPMIDADAREALQQVAPQPALQQVAPQGALQQAAPHTDQQGSPQPVVLQQVNPAQQQEALQQAAPQALQQVVPLPVALQQVNPVPQALQQENANMVQQLDQAAVQALIDAAVQAFKQQVQAQMNQHPADLAIAQQQWAQRQADLLAAQNQVVAIKQAQQAGVQVAQHIDLAYTPGTFGNPTDLINYKVATGGKIQKAAIKKLDIIHDLDSEHLYDWLESLRTRAIAHGWLNTLLMLIIIQATPLANITINILENYGLLPEVIARDHAQTYMFFNNRAAQNSHNMYHSLEASLTPDARQILN